MRILVISPAGDLQGTVHEEDCDDLDGRFRLIEDDTGDVFYVNGWQCDIEILED